MRPPQTSTVGGPEPLANLEPVSVSVAFTAALAVEAAVSIGVTSELKEKLQGRSEPDVDNLVGSV